MSALRFLYLIALSIWAGGLFVLGAVTAPAVFDSLQARSPDMGRVLAGAAFGATLARFHGVALACGGVMLLSLIGMALIGPRPRPYGLRLGVIVAMLAFTAAAGLPLQQRMQHLQASVIGPISRLPDADPRKTEFTRAHRVSSGLLGATALGALGLLFWEARERRT